jgi:hypothetical protein
MWCAGQGDHLHCEVGSASQPATKQGFHGAFALLPNCWPQHPLHLKWQQCGDWGREGWPEEQREERDGLEKCEDGEGHGDGRRTLIRTEAQRKLYWIKILGPVSLKGDAPPYACLPL